MEKEIQRVWRIADTDNSGRIDPRELGNLMRVLNDGVQPTAAEVAAMLKLMDSDNSGTVEFAEFAKAMSEWLSADGSAPSEATEASAAAAASGNVNALLAKVDGTHGGSARAAATPGARLELQDNMKAFFKLGSGSAPGAEAAHFTAEQLQAALTSTLAGARAGKGLTAGGPGAGEGAAASSASSCLAEDAVGGLFARGLSLHPTLANGRGPAGLSETQRAAAFQVAQEVYAAMPALDGCLGSNAITDLRQWVAAVRAVRLMLSVRDYYADLGTSLKPAVRDAILRFYDRVAELKTWQKLLSLLHPAAASDAGVPLGTARAAPQAAAVAGSGAAPSSSAAASGYSYTHADVGSKRRVDFSSGGGGAGYGSGEEDEDGADAVGDMLQRAKRQAVYRPPTGAGASAAGAAGSAGGGGVGACFGEYSPSDESLGLLERILPNVPSLSQHFQASRSDIPLPLAASCAGAGPDPRRMWHTLQLEALRCLTYFILGPRLPHTPPTSIWHPRRLAGLLVPTVLQHPAGYVRHIMHTLLTTGDPSVLSAAATLLAAIARASRDAHYHVAGAFGAGIGVLARLSDIAGTMAGAVAAPEAAAVSAEEWMAFIGRGLTAPVGAAGADGTTATLLSMLQAQGTVHLLAALADPAGLGTAHAAASAAGSGAGAAPAVDATADGDALGGSGELGIELMEGLVGSFSIMCGGAPLSADVVSFETLVSSLGGPACLRALHYAFVTPVDALRSVTALPPDDDDSDLAVATRGRYHREERAVHRMRSYVASAFAALLPLVADQDPAAVWPQVKLHVDALAARARAEQPIITALCCDIAFLDLRLQHAKAAAASAAAAGGAASDAAVAQRRALQRRADDLYLCLRARSHVLCDTLRVLRRLSIVAIKAKAVPVFLSDVLASVEGGADAAVALHAAIQQPLEAAVRSLCIEAGMGAAETDAVVAARRAQMAASAVTPGVPVDMPASVYLLFCTGILDTVAGLLSGSQSVQRLALDPGSWRQAWESAATARGPQIVAAAAAAAAYMPPHSQLTTLQAAVAHVCREILDSSLRFVAVSAQFSAAAQPPAPAVFPNFILSHRSTGASSALGAGASLLQGVADCLSDRMSEALAQFAASKASAGVLAGAAAPAAPVGVGALPPAPAGAAAAAAAAPVAALAGGAAAESETRARAVTALKTFATVPSALPAGAALALPAPTADADAASASARAAQLKLRAESSVALQLLKAPEGALGRLSTEIVAMCKPALNVQLQVTRGAFLFAYDALADCAEALRAVTEEATTVLCQAGEVLRSCDPADPSAFALRRELETLPNAALSALGLQAVQALYGIVGVCHEDRGPTGKLSLYLNTLSIEQAQRAVASVHTMNHCLFGIRPPAPGEPGWNHAVPAVEVLGAPQATPAGVDAARPVAERHARAALRAMFQLASVCRSLGAYGSVPDAAAAAAAGVGAAGYAGPAVATPSATLAAAADTVLQQLTRTADDIARADANLLASVKLALHGRVAVYPASPGAYAAAPAAPRAGAGAVPFPFAAPVAPGAPASAMIEMVPTQLPPGAAPAAFIKGPIALQAAKLGRIAALNVQARWAMQDQRLFLGVLRQAPAGSAEPWQFKCLLEGDAESEAALDVAIERARAQGCPSVFLVGALNDHQWPHYSELYGTQAAAFEQHVAGLTLAPPVGVAASMHTDGAAAAFGFDTLAQFPFQQRLRQVVAKYGPARVHVPLEWVGKVCALAAQAAAAGTAAFDVHTFAQLAIASGAAFEADRPLLEDMFSLIDLNGDGTVDCREIRARLVLFCACPQEDRLFHIFSVFDADASGYIDAVELQHLIATVTGLTPSPEEVVAYGSGAVPAQVRLIADDIMRRYDASGDGRLDFAEFRSGAATDPRLGGAFWTVSH